MPTGWHLIMYLIIVRFIFDTDPNRIAYRG